MSLEERTLIKKKEPRKVILFYNPFSGNGMFSGHLDHIIERFQAAGKMIVPVRASEEMGIGDYLSEINPDTYRDEYCQILAAGGDGTINVCVNAMIRYGIDLPLGIFPAGTANDFAYYFNIPNDIDGMLDIALSGNHTRADVGVCNGKYFINVAALGQVIDVSQSTDPMLKNSIGVLAYYLKGLTEIPNLKPVRVKLTTPDTVYTETMNFMVVMNGRSAGGFKQISPESEINDGLLDVIVFKKIPLMELPTLFFKVLNGTHVSSRKVLYFQTDRLTVESKHSIPTDIDGEHGEKLPLHFSVLHDKLRICTEKDNI